MFVAQATSLPSICAIQELDECLKLIEVVLEETEGLCEFALYVKALIKRQRGQWDPGYKLRNAKLYSGSCHVVSEGPQACTLPSLSMPMQHLPCTKESPIPDPVCCAPHTLTTGQIQESLQLFQQATALNPHNVANLKQVSTAVSEAPLLWLLGCSTCLNFKAAW